jgi:hypothetical protein
MENKFTDFNFKLAVIQVLMYEKKVLQPAFDIHNFVRKYTGRKINIEKEGYKIIPEVKKFFEDLEIPSELLNKVEKIYQGSNKIYLQLCPFWSGEDELFNITKTEDLRLLPNLKKITLYYDDEKKMVNEFKAKGIDAEYL